MPSPDIVSPEVVARIDRNAMRLFMLLGELRLLASEQRNARTMALSDALSEGLRDQMGLVRGIMDAIVDDVPPTRRVGRRE
jgi:hypothetical protein